MTARPFLKWVGGKRQILNALMARVPKAVCTYFEPFVGGGALFFALTPGRAFLSDQNEWLVRAYKGVRDDVEGVIARLSTYPHDRVFFEEMRKRDIDLESDADVAAWLIYLNKTCFNGLYRVNRKNLFNVPFGRYENPTICNAELLRTCSAALREVSLSRADFSVVLERARPGDFVYFDPPYAPLSATSSFTSYTAEGFGPCHQIRLRDTALELKERGVSILLSNSSAGFIREIFSGQKFMIEEVMASRNVSSKGTTRGKIPELLIH
jgi:DNA adenine methylase